MVSGFLSYLKHLWQLVRLIHRKITKVYSAAHELTLLRQVQGSREKSMFTYERKCFPYLLLPNRSTAVSLSWELSLCVSVPPFRASSDYATQETNSASLLTCTGHAPAPITAVHFQDGLPSLKDNLQ